MRIQGDDCANTCRHTVVFRALAGVVPLQDGLDDGVHLLRVEVPLPDAEVGPKTGETL